MILEDDRPEGLADSIMILPGTFGTLEISATNLRAKGFSFCGNISPRFRASVERFRHKPPYRTGDGRKLTSDIYCTKLNGDIAP
jgi:hypothetical protein